LVTVGSLKLPPTARLFAKIKVTIKKQTTKVVFDFCKQNVRRQWELVSIAPNGLGIAEGGDF